jgi:microcystin-dependent protein
MPMKRLINTAILLALVSCLTPRPAAAQASEPYLGEIQLFAFRFCPTGWAMLNGQLLTISQNAALFNLLGTTYGGDGVTTFALPKWGPINGANGGPFTACIALQGVYPSQT